MDKDNYYNNKGQEDRSDGKYNPPSNLEEKEEYDKAWEVTKAQQDFNDRNYNPPSNLEEKESYDKSWDDTKDNNESQKDGGCFITSACVKANGLPDNCYELEILRLYRDTYILNLPQGNILIKEYYQNAPKIVTAINKNLRQKEIYIWLFKELIQKSVNKIKAGDNVGTLNNYTAIYKYLEHNFT